MVEWMAFYKMNPFGLERQDYQAGIIASTIANVNRTKKSDKVWKPQEFIPEYGKKEEPNWKEMKSNMMIWTMLFQSRENKNQ